MCCEQNDQSQRDKAFDELRLQFAVFSAASGSVCYALAAISICR